MPLHSDYQKMLELFSPVFPCSLQFLILAVKYVDQKHGNGVGKENTRENVHVADVADHSYDLSFVFRHVDVRDKRRKEEVVFVAVAAVEDKVRANGYVCEDACPAHGCEDYHSTTSVLDAIPCHWKRQKDFNELSGVAGKVIGRVHDRNETEPGQ